MILEGDTQDSLRSNDLEEAIAVKIEEMEAAHKKWGDLMFKIQLRDAEEIDRYNKALIEHGGHSLAV